MKMKRRLISLCMAGLLALQPSTAVMAKSEEQSVVRGEDYTIRTHADGSKTMTVFVEIEASDYTETAGKDHRGIEGLSVSEDARRLMSADPSEHEKEIKVEVEIIGSGEDSVVSVECGDIQISFEAEIMEDETALENAGLKEGAQLEPASYPKTRSADEDASGEPITESQDTAETEYLAEGQPKTADEKVTEKGTEVQTNPPTEKATEAQTEPPTEKATEAPTEPPTEKATEVQTEPPTEPVTETQTNPPTEPVTEVQTNPPTEPVTEVQTNPPTEPVTENRTEDSEDTGTESETELPSETMTEESSEPETTSEPVTESETASENNTEPVTDMTDSGQAETETDREQITETIPGSAPSEENTTEEVTEPETGTEAVSENGTEAVSETESEIETESETEAETETETESETESETETIPDSELRYTKLENGIKEELVIYGYRGGHRIDYSMDLGGLTPVQEGNAFRLTDGDGNEMASISAPYLYDAAGETCYDVAVSMVQEADGTWTLSYVPDDAWLAEESRAYPVVLDPTLTINSDQLIEDNYVQNANDTNYYYGNGTMLAGNKGGKNYSAFIRPAFTDAFKEKASSYLITDATVKLYVQSQVGNQTYEFYRVTEDWTSTTITGKPLPDRASSPFYSGKLSDGYNTIDIKPLVSKWFNCLDQKPNYGFTIRGNNSSGNHIVLSSVDRYDSEAVYRPEFTIKYREVSSKSPNFTGTAYGNEAGSGTGYIELSWDKVNGAEDYYLAVYNGKEYEYFELGDVTSYSTKGKGIWPTEAEIAAGRYNLHSDGLGSDLPCIPAYTYQNGGTAYADRLEYFFRLVPANSYGQAVNPKIYDDPVKIVLPDRISPAQAAAVAVSPFGYTNGDTMAVSWNGIQDFNTTSPSITNTLGTGCVQYSVDSTTGWTDTGVNAASGSYTFDISGLSDGTHVVYVRGKDSEGNTGAANGVNFYIDRTGPEGHTVSVSPSGWTNGNTAKIAWSGMADVSGIRKVEYRIGSGAWTDTGSAAADHTGITVNTGSLADGIYVVYLRGVDVHGNVGPEASASLSVDRTGPTGQKTTVTPDAYTNGNTIKLSWSGMTDWNSITDTQYKIGNGTWKSTGQAKAAYSGYVIDVSGLADGSHTLSFRGIDSLGNAGAVSTRSIRIDRTGPTGQTVALDPAGYSNQKEVKVSWSGLADWNPIARTQYKLHNGAWTDTGITSGSYTGFPVDTGSLTDGRYALLFRGIDSLGNIGAASTNYVYIDRTGPYGQEIQVTPADWTNAQEVSLSWSGMYDWNAVAKTEYRIDEGAWTDTGITASDHTGFVIDISALSDGMHTLRFRGIDEFGNIGTAYGAYILVDRTGPAGQSLGILPEGWNTGNEVSLSWEGMQDRGQIARTEYRIDGGEWLDTGIAAAAHTGFTVDTADLPDGEHTISLRGTDRPGNTGPEETVLFVIDRTAPQIGAAGITPDAWSNADTAILSWECVTDAVSGVAGMEYNLDGEWRTAEEIPGDTETVPEADPEEGTEEKAEGKKEENGSMELDLSQLADGVHTILFRATDRAGNVSEPVEVQLYRDTAAPEAVILDPADNAILEGVFEIRGTVTDEHLKSWSLYAADSSDTETLIHTWSMGSGDTEENEPVENAILGQLDLGRYPDGENILLTLMAEDEAGNRSQHEICVIRIGGSMRAFDATLLLEVPPVMTKAAAAGTYSPSADSEAAWVYIDGRQEDTVTENGSLTIDAVRYAEGSSHTVSMISRNGNGLLYSKGLGSQDLMEELWEAGAPLQDGIWMSSCLTGMRPVLALRLNVTDFTPGDSSITYEYSTDGQVWETIVPDEDLVLPAPVKEVYIRAALAADGEDIPKLYRMAVQGVMELSPQTFSVKLRKDAGTFHFTVPEKVTEAFTEIETGKAEGSAGIQWYLDGTAVDLAEDRLDARYIEEGKTAKLTGIQKTGEDAIRMPGGSGTLLLREDTKAASGIRESSDIICPAGIKAVRLLASVRGEGAVFSCSTDSGTTWKELEENGITLLDKETDRIRIRAEIPEGSSLMGWHLEGYAPASKTVKAVLAETPSMVTAADYGAFDDRRYELAWEDSQKADGTAPYQDSYQIYRNGKKAASVTGCSYTDETYISGAVYTVEKVRTYEGGEILPYRVRTSEAAKAKMTVMVPEKEEEPPKPQQPEESVQQPEKPLPEKPEYIEPDQPAGTVPEKPEETAPADPEGTTPEKPSVQTSDGTTEHLPDGIGQAASTGKPAPVVYELEVEQQPDMLTSLYGGDMRFKTGEDVPDADLALNQELLGRNKLCSLGFEPVNFNTGNFFLEAEDFVRETTSGPDFRMLRTYNAQSTDTDGLFGAKWASEYSQYLQGYEDGTVGYRKADGALVLFTPVEDTYVCSSADHLVLIKTEDGYTIEEQDGTGYRFSTVGLLLGIEEKGQCIQLIRDGRSVLSEVRLSDGTVTGVQTDEKGHITALIQPGGAKTTYQYEGNNLVSVTDPAGNTVRYVYDGQGRMTEWYDKAGNRQVYNEYDDQSRVTYQTDARDGEYRIEYLSDHTVTTDAEGVQCEVWFDHELRTVREVDGNGNEYLYSYDEAGNLTGRTDKEGRLTSYTYDEDGRHLSTVLPDGTEVDKEYDGSGSLVLESDANGNITRYEYDTDGRLTKTIYADGSEECREYDENGRLVTVTDVLGGVTEYTCDEVGNQTSRTDALGNTEYYEYDSDGRMTIRTDALGYQTVYEYDLLGQLVRMQTADGLEVQYTYDSLGNMTSRSGADGSRTEYEYDSLGNCVKTIYPDGGVETKEYSPSGLLVKETDAMGGVTSYTYDAAGNQISVTDALGNTTSYEYDAEGLVTRMVLPTGAEETYVYDAATGLLIETTDTAGATARFEYDREGNITAQYMGDTPILRTEYDSRNRVSSTTDAAGNVTSYTYDAAGNQTSITDALGNVTSYEYDLLGRKTAEVDACGARTEYVYDAAGNLIKKTDPLGAETTYRYDAAGNMVSRTDAYGNMTVWEYNAAGLPVKETNAAGAATEKEYDAMGRLTKETRPDGGIHTYAYDLNGNLTEESYPEGGTMSYAYDALGQNISLTDVLGKTAYFTYDSFGNVTHTLDADGSETSYLYDAAGRLLEQTDETGSTTVYVYDETGRLASMQTGDSKVSYTYDRLGQLTGLSDGTGWQLTYTYDAHGRVTEIIYADGTSDYMGYDACGRVIWQELRDGSYTDYSYDACGNVLYCDENGTETIYTYDLLGRKLSESTGGAETSYAYDVLGQVVSETADGQNITYTYDVSGNLTGTMLMDGTGTQSSYDRNGRLVSMTDASGSHTSYTYDEADRLLTVTDALGNVTSYTYDVHDNISTVTDALGHTTAYTWDASGHLLSETDALGNTVSYEYTQEGWLFGMTDAAGEKTVYTYDAAGRVTKIQYADGSSVSHTYDTDGNLVESSGVDGTTSYRYDEFGQLTEVGYPDGQKVGYEYDLSGSRTALIYPDGSRASYEYDGYGRLISFTGPDGTVATYTYDDMGRITSMTDGADTTTYTRDALGNLTGIDVAGEHALSLRYTYDANGSILSEERTEGGVSITSVYAYDALGRLVSWQTDDGKAESYTYDAAGNMLTKTVDGQEIRMSYDAANRMVSMENGQGQIRYRYDADGNLTVKEYNGSAGGADGILTDTYAYNAQGRLSSYTGYDGSSVAYTYASTGLLSEKTSTGEEGRSTLEELLAGTDTASAVLPTRPGAALGQPSVTSYLYDLTDTYGQVLAEDTDGAGTLYLYGLERTAALTTADGITECTGYQYDARGSVIRTITGSSIASHRYTPYGEQILTDGERKASGYLYNGEAYDAMTGSYYLRARHYEPAMMRFSQPDIVRGSITEPLSQNRYLYVQDNPMRYEDPSGENVFLAGLAAAGIGLTTALKQGAKGITAQAVQATQDTQKTTSQVIRAIKASAGLKTIVDALNKSTAGKVVVQLGTAFVNVVTRGQAEAVVKAQEAYDAIKDSNPESVRKWQKAVQEACRVLSEDSEKTPDGPKEGSDAWIGQRISELEKQYPSMNARQQTMFDDMLEELIAARLDGQGNKKEIYDTYMAEIEAAKDYKDEPQGKVDYWPDLDTFMMGEAKTSVPFDEIVEGVLIEGREEPYTREELEQYIRTAKSRGKKIDYVAYENNQFIHDPQFGESGRQWREKAGKTIGVLAVGGIMIYAGVRFGPQVAEALGTSAAAFFSSVTPPAVSTAGSGAVIVHNAVNMEKAGAAAAGIVNGVAISAGINYFKGNISDDIESEKSEYMEQLDNMSDNKINHLINGSRNSNHGWEKLVSDKDWNKIKRIVVNVMEKGKEGKYKSVFSKKLVINGYEVEVTYTKLSNGTIRISDAWIN